MGCFGSRFDKRNGVADDLNTVAFQFVGGEAHETDKCPIDKIAVTYGEGKEVADFAKVGPLKCTDEEVAKKVALAAANKLKEHAAWLEKEYGTPDKDVYVGDKYELKDAKAQIAAVKAFLQEKNPQWADDYPKDEPKEEPAMEMMEGEMMAEMMAEEMMEGGDEMMAEMMAKEDLYASDSAAYDGHENLPALLLRCMVVHPYFGDLVKRDTISAEFNDKPKHSDWTEVSVITGLAVNEGETEEKEVWFAGYLGAEDVEAIKLIPENGAIMFPGIVATWASEAEAVKVFADDLHAKNDVKKVCFTVKTKVVSAVVCRQFVYRLMAKLEKQEDKDGVLMCTLADDSWEHKTMAEWEAWKVKMKEEAEAAAKAAAEAAAAEGADKAMEGAEMAADMAADMAMDPPAE